MQRTAETLLETGLNRLHIERATRYAEEADIRLLSACCELGYLQEIDALILLRKRLGVPYIRQVELKSILYRFDIVSVDLCRRYMALPLRKFSRTLLMVMQDPSDRLLQQTLEVHSGLIIKPIVSLQRTIRSALDAHDVDHVIDDAQIVSVSHEPETQLQPRRAGPGEYKSRKAEAIKNLKLGLEAMQKSAWPHAIDFLQTSVRLDPFDVRPHLYLARMHEGLDNPLDALASYKRVLAIDEHNSKATTGMARLTRKLT